MKAYVTSIGEPTTDLCLWSLNRQGIETVLINDPSTTLAEKLKFIYFEAKDDFLRVDADVIPNRKVLTIADYEPDAWWVQGRCYGWYSQDLIYGGVQLIRKEALPDLRANIGKHMNDERPESAMFRLPEFHNPRKCISSDLVAGIHGWGQNDLQRVKGVKARRNQSAGYDWELVERMSEL